MQLLRRLVAGLFAFASLLLIFPALGVVLRWKLPGHQDVYFRSELDLLDGLLSILVALGIYRKDSRVWVFALVVAGLNLLAGAVATWLTINVYSALWLSAWFFVVLWLCQPSVRSEFARPAKSGNAA